MTTNHPNFGKYDSQRVYLKYCLECGDPMFNVWKTRKYCSSACQHKNALTRAKQKYEKL